MKWKKCRFDNLIIFTKKDDLDIFLKINKEIPGDIFHLDFASIDIYKEHEDGQYLYIISANPEDYDDDELVPIIETFYVKHKDILVDTKLRIANYIER